MGVRKVECAEQGKMVEGMRWCGVACVYDADYGHGACDEDEEAGALNIDAVWCSFPLAGICTTTSCLGPSQSRWGI